MEVVQIEESIKDTFLWNDANKLRWWLDLLFLSKDGIVDVSTRGLQARWGAGSRNTIKAFLSNLEACGLAKISCVTDPLHCPASLTHVNGGSFTRITICKTPSCKNTNVGQQGGALTHVIDPLDRPTKHKTTREEKEVRFQKANAEFIESLRPFVHVYGRDMINEFYKYWSEPNKSKTKMRFEQEKTWDLNRRLERWSNNNKNRNNGNTTDNTMQYVINRIETAQ